jgi:hypothetical protein
MARRSAQSVLKRAREQALREKRELKKAKKDARAEQRRNPDGSPEIDGTEPEGDTGAEATDPEAEATAPEGDAG